MLTSKPELPSSVYLKLEGVAYHPMTGKSGELGSHFKHETQ